MKGQKRKLLTGLILTLVFCVSQAFLSFAVTKAADVQIQLPSFEDLFAQLGEGQEDTALQDETAGNETGFATKEDAARAYIEGLIGHDVQQMLSACALETYVKHYDLERQIERLRSLPPIASNAYLPANGDLAYQINLETRRSELTKMIQYQYLSMTGVDIDRRISPVILEDNSSAGDLISSVFGPEITEISMEGDVFPGYLLSPLMLEGNGQWGGAMAAYADHADRIDSVAAILRIDGELFLLTLGTECFDGTWYVTNFNILQNIMGMDMYTGGLVPMEVGISDEEVRALMDIIQNDENLNAIFGKVENAFSSLDLEEIFAVSDLNNIRRESYTQALDTAVREYLTEEELAYLSAIME